MRPTQLDDDMLTARRQPVCTLGEELVHGDADDGDADAEVGGQRVTEERGGHDAREDGSHRAAVLLQDCVRIPAQRSMQIEA